MSSVNRCDVEDEVILRKATKSDLNRISFLLEQLGYPQINAELYKRFTVYQNNKGYGIIVACLKNRAIGIIAWSKSYRFT